MMIRAIKSNCTGFSAVRKILSLCGGLVNADLKLERLVLKSSKAMEEVIGEDLIFWPN